MRYKLEINAPATEAGLASVPAWHLEVLAARETDICEGGDNFIDWDAAKAELRQATR